MTDGNESAQAERELRVLKWVGKGTFANVGLAQLLPSSTVVAVKFYRRQSDPAICKRSFHEEKDALERVGKHPNIVAMAGAQGISKGFKSAQYREELRVKQDVFGWGERLLQAPWVWFKFVAKQMGRLI